MLSDQKYVTQSLELHLFFARIMKEHAIFLEASFTPKNANFSKEADNYKVQLETILSNAAKVSSGLISSDVLSSGEIITDFTLGTEQKTQNFTAIPINQDITIMEARLHSGNPSTVTKDVFEYVKQLNYHAKAWVNGLIKFKEMVLDSVLSCNMFTSNYPMMIEHILHEARLYRDYLTDLDNGEDIEARNMKETEVFWDEIMMEHALFIRGLLDPSEVDLIHTADNFSKEYTMLLESARNATDRTISGVTNETLEETMKYKDFKTAGVKGISECKIRSIIVPLLADHVLREANHFIRLLKK